jgi:hypothetical protein
VGVRSRLRGKAWDTDQVVAAVFVAIAVGSLIVEAAQAPFWGRRRDVEPAGAALELLVLVALLRRHRWAWWIFVLASVWGLPSFVIYGVVHGPGWTTAVGLIIGLVELALLFSTPMRRFVRSGATPYGRCDNPLGLTHCSEAVYAQCSRMSWNLHRCMSWAFGHWTWSTSKCIGAMVKSASLAPFEYSLKQYLWWLAKRGAVKFNPYTQAASIVWACHAGLGYRVGG